ncbi:hypothetical protein T439DRAFT_351979 [Meredithblackwellia eburnea MCA 4105]
MHNPAGDVGPVETSFVYQELQPSTHHHKTLLWQGSIAVVSLTVVTVLWYFTDFKQTLEVGDTDPITAEDYHLSALTTMATVSWWLSWIGAGINCASRSMGFFEERYEHKERKRNNEKLDENTYRAKARVFMLYCGFIVDGALQLASIVGQSTEPTYLIFQTPMIMDAAIPLLLDPLAMRQVGKDLLRGMYQTDTLHEFGGRHGKVPIIACFLPERKRSCATSLPKLGSEHPKYILRNTDRTVAASRTTVVIKA